MRKILILTSTYPLNAEDTQPRFIEYLSLRLSEFFSVLVIAPAILGQQGDDGANSNPGVARFRYFFRRYERLCGGDGVLENLKREKWLWLLFPFFLTAMMYSVLSNLRKNEIDLIHAHWILPQGLIAVLCSKLTKQAPPIVLTSHGGDLFALQGRLFTFLKKYVLHNVSRITVVSHAMKEHCVGELGIDENKISIIPMGVDLDSQFVPSGPKKHRRLVYVGRLAEKKGVDVLLSALSQLNDIDGVHLDVLGGGTELQRYRLMAESLGISNRVVFHGAIPNSDVATFLKDAAIAVFPFKVASDGDQEGLGLTVVEAMGCECIVVVSDLPAVRDIVSHGETGMLVKPNDIDGLALQLREVILKDNDYAKLAKDGREHALQKFEWGSVTARYHRLFSLVLSQS